MLNLQFKNIHKQRNNLSQSIHISPIISTQGYGAQLVPPCISHQFFFPWLPLFSRLQPFFHYFNFFFMTSIFFPWLKLFLMTSTFFQDFTFPTWLQLFLMTSIFWHDFNFPAWHEHSGTTLISQNDFLWSVIQQCP